jgi:predicted nuclease with TOPRIM domain
MKQIENYEQLLERFYKRTTQLEEEQGKLDEYYERWMRLNSELDRLKGSIQAVEYLAYGKLPQDGNHNGMADHEAAVSLPDSSLIPGVDVSDQGPGLYPESI